MPLMPRQHDRIKRIRHSGDWKLKEAAQRMHRNRQRREVVKLAFQTDTTHLTLDDGQPLNLRLADKSELPVPYERRIQLS